MLNLNLKKYLKKPWVKAFLIFIATVIILFVYFYQTQPSVTGQRWVKKCWSLLEKGECEKALSCLDYGLIRYLEKNIKKIALENSHQELGDYDCHLKIISNDLKINMTRGQIDRLKPIDILCWCRQHYDSFFQGNYDISFTSDTKKILYVYEIKRKDKIIGRIAAVNFSYGNLNSVGPAHYSDSKRKSVAAAHYSDSNWKIEWIFSECGD
jgi:hypothetical protein